MEHLIFELMDRDKKIVPVYDSSIGKFRRTCHNPYCIEPNFWGRQDQLYCSRGCKNLVGNKKWREENPKLTSHEKEIRRNHRILQVIASEQGYNKWLAKNTLAQYKFNGKKYHSYTERLLQNNIVAKVITLFDLEVLILDDGRTLINKSIQNGSNI